MTNDERAAREWLKHLQRPGVTSATWADNAATILRLLDRPVLPTGAEVPDDALQDMLLAYQKELQKPGPYWTVMRGVVDALHAHLTAPPPAKKVEVWAVVDATGQRVLCRKQSDAEYWRGIYHGSRVVKLVEAADDQ